MTTKSGIKGIKIVEKNKDIEYGRIKSDKTERSTTRNHRHENYPLWELEYLITPIQVINGLIKSEGIINIQNLRWAFLNWV